MYKKIFLISIAILIGFAFTTVQRPTHIFMIGDSTMANKPNEAIPEYGWGQVLQYFFNDSIIIENHAKNGRSSKSFINEGRWDKVTQKLNKGDYVIIQFGHNDSKPDSARHTDPYTTYKENLLKYINETKEKGATPILCSSIVRRSFTDNGILEDTHGDYLKAVKEVANETNVYFIDMEQKSRKLVLEMGQEKSKQLFLHFGSNIYPQRPKGKTDNTHLSQLGAFSIAGLAVEGMKELNIPITKNLVTNFN